MWMLFSIRVAPIFSSALSVQICWCQEVLAQAYITWHGPGSLMNTHSHTQTQTYTHTRQRGLKASQNSGTFVMCAHVWRGEITQTTCTWVPFLHYLFTLISSLWRRETKWYTPFTTETNPEEWICFLISVSMTSSVRSLCRSVGWALFTPKHVSYFNVTI